MSNNLEHTQYNLVDAIAGLIDEHHELIIENYKDRDNQILIKNELRDKIFALVESVENEKLNQKEIIKSGVREAFRLKGSDIVIVKQDSIFVKLFEYCHKNDSVNPIANRYNGIDESELASFYKEHFALAKNKTFFKVVAKLFFEKYFLRHKISNHEYEQNVFGYIQAIMTEELLHEFDYSEEFFKGFAGFLFRLYFKEVFEDIAELMLIELAASNSFIITFLKYYSLDIVVLGGTKYRVPSLLSENDMRWNVISMLSVVKLYIKVKISSKELYEYKAIKEEEIQKLYRNGVSPIEYNRLFNLEKDKVTNTINGLQNKLDKDYDLLRIRKDETEKEILREDITFLKRDIQKLKEEKNILLNKLIPKGEINKYVSLQKEIDSTYRLAKREERIMSQNEEAFKSIKNALVKALTSKKQPI